VAWGRSAPGQQRVNGGRDWRLATGMKALCVLLVFAGILLVSGCKDEEAKSSWVRSPVTVDGNLDDWKDVHFVVFQDDHLAFGAENDSTYLYLAGRTSDADLARAMDRMGVTLWVDAKGGDSKDIEIRFPVGRSADFRLSRGGFWESLTEEQQSEASKEMDEMRKGVLVIDNRSVTSHIYSPGSAEGFAADVGESSGIATFEIRIPLDLQEYMADIGSLGPKDKVGVGIQLDEFGRGREGIPGGARQGMGQWGGRGRGGFGGFPRRGQTEGNSTETWVEISLATAK
jgi:hypothetical protein